MSEPVTLEASMQLTETGIVGRSFAIRRAVELARRFAPTSLPMLIVGATGTGKELFARSIHEWSGRSGEFVDVNCGALPPDLVEALLFGHRRGAWTDAVESMQGMLEAADHGTLFLDELCSLPVPAQVKLLRALECGEIRRIGETIKRRTDFRLIAAAQENFRELVAAGTFRRDVYYRVAGVVINLPPLSQRMEDVEPLARAFADGLGSGIAACGLAALAGHTWPGNARELRAAVERAAHLVEVPPITAAEMRAAMQLGVGLDAYALPPADEDRALLVNACHLSAGRAQMAAAILGVSRATLFRRLKAHGLTLRLAGPSHRLTESCDS
jgi:transcriptional regulator with PAS, ATPase and Fis domain